MIYLRPAFAVLAMAALLLLSSGAMAERYTIPLFAAPGAGGDPQGVLRVVNDADAPATVSILAVDDAGVRTGPATLRLNASAAVQLSATELQSANASKGLASGLGSLAGHVRLVLDSDLPVVPSAYVRAADGTLSAMHNTVRVASSETAGEYRYDVPVFYRSTEMTQVSRLRLINPGDTAAAVTMSARDDGGAEATGGDVTLTLAAGGAKMLTAQQLEAGDADITGRLGAGTGKWRLTVSSDRPLQVVNVVSSTAGYWNNLSTTAVPGAAPVDAEAFGARFADGAIVYEGRAYRGAAYDSRLRVQPDGRFTETWVYDGAEATKTGRYGYESIGTDAGRFTLTYSGGDECRGHLYFGSPTEGWLAWHCTASNDPDWYWLAGDWSVEPDEDDDGGGGAADDHGDDRASATRVEVGSDTAGVLTADDEDYFRIDVSGTGTLEVYSSGRIDTRGYLQDAGGSQLSSNDDGGAGTNFRMSEEVSSGTYYVRVTGYSSRTAGDYTLHVRFTDSSTGGGAGGSYGVNDALPGVPKSGSFIPSGAGGGIQFQASGAGTTIVMNDGAYFELSDGTRYTCAATGGCTVANGTVTRGSLTGPASGSGDGEVDRFPTFRSAAAPGDQSYTVGTAIDTLTLPEASGGNGDLTYSLSPNVSGLTFNPGTRQLTGTPTKAGSYAMSYAARDVDGDTDTLGFTITVSAGASTEGSLGTCYVGMTLSSGQSCSYPGRTDEFSVNARGRGSFLDRLAGIRLRFDNETINGRVYDFEASHQGDGAWRIDRIAGSGTGAPELTVGSASVSDSSPDAGQSFTLRATVRNGGNASSPATTLRYYRSTNASISTSDTAVGTDSVSGLSASGTSAESISLTAPSIAGTYYYGACVDSVTGESDTDNNCSSAVRVDVAGSGAGAPDLTVGSASVSDSSPDAGQSFTLRATVRNGGNASSPATTLRYYRSTNASISTSDTAVGTDSVSGLSASGTSAESISLTAPSSAGTYYYGACVDSVSGESDIGNNCSSAARVTIASSTPPFALVGGSCSGRRTFGDFVDVTVSGSIRANRSVNVVILQIDAYANGQFVGSDLMSGNFDAGDSRSFSIFGVISTSSSTISCRVEWNLTELTSGTQQPVVSASGGVVGTSSGAIRP